MAHEYHYDKEMDLVYIRWMDNVDYMDVYETLMQFNYPMPEHGHRIVLDFNSIKSSQLMSDDLMRLATLVKQYIGEKLAGAKIALLTTNSKWKLRARFYIACRRLLSKNAPEYGVFGDTDTALIWVHSKN